jgi:ribonuclease VapC
MVIDSSALVSIVLEEPGFSFYVESIAKAATRWMSAASMLETSIVVSREKGADGIAVLKKFLADSRIQVVEFTEHQAHLAFAAHQRFGKGMGHPAQLNILDCCTYALAADLKEPLLFKGADFDKTDLALAK